MIALLRPLYLKRRGQLLELRAWKYKSALNLRQLRQLKGSESHENLKFSPQSKFVLEIALQVVRLQGKKSIGTEHLLWGLVRLAETDNATLSHLFQRYEVDFAVLNNQLVETI